MSGALSCAQWLSWRTGLAPGAALSLSGLSRPALGVALGIRRLERIIMTFDPKKYPENWRKFSLDIRFDRAKGQCECTGECGLHQPSMFTATQEPRRCVERNGEDAKWAKGRIMLTVAHLNAPGGPCSCIPHCAIAEHVKAMCQRCHLKYDIERHVRHRTEKRDAKRLKNRIV